MASIAGWLWLASGIVMALSLLGGVIMAFTKYRPGLDDPYGYSYFSGSEATWYLLEVPSMLFFALGIPALIIRSSLRYRNGSPAAWSWLTVLSGLVFSVMYLSVRYRMKYGAADTDMFYPIALIGLFLAAALACTALGLSLTNAARAHTFRDSRVAGAPASIVMIGAAWSFATGTYLAAESALSEYGYVVPTVLRGFGDTNTPIENAVAVVLFMVVYVTVSIVLLGVVRAFIQGSGTARTFLAMYAGILVANVFFLAVTKAITTDTETVDSWIEGDSGASTLGVLIAVIAAIAAFLPPAGKVFAAQTRTPDFTLVDGQRGPRIAALLWGASAHFAIMAFLPFLGLFVQLLVASYQILEMGGELSDNVVPPFLYGLMLGAVGVWVAVAIARHAFRLFTRDGFESGLLKRSPILFFIAMVALIPLLFEDVQFELGIVGSFGLQVFLVLLATGLAVTAAVVTYDGSSSAAKSASAGKHRTPGQHNPVA